MDRWRGRIAVVTGASSGIGSAICVELLKAGMIVVGLARREQRLEELREAMPAQYRANFHTRCCDVTDDAVVKQVFQWVDTKFGHVDVLVNNAGVLRKTELVAADNSVDMQDTVQTNIMGTVYCTREAFNLMRLRGVDDGHVVVINSYSGHVTPNLGNAFPSFNIYPATKHALTSMVETYRQEFLRFGTKVRITSISPGLVDTEIFPTDMDNAIRYVKMPMLKSEDVANAVLYAVGSPPHVQIHEVIIKPVGELA